jgi:hypothetical protein
VAKTNTLSTVLLYKKFGKRLDRLKKLIQFKKTVLYLFQQKKLFSKLFFGSSEVETKTNSTENRVCLKVSYKILSNHSNNLYINFAEIKIDLSSI